MENISLYPPNIRVHEKQEWNLLVVQQLRSWTLRQPKRDQRYAGTCRCLHTLTVYPEVRAKGVHVRPRCKQRVEVKMYLVSLHINMEWINMWQQARETRAWSDICLILLQLHRHVLLALSTTVHCVMCHSNTSLTSATE